MAGYGLLAGFGRGLSQGAELLNRGMAEDRDAERQRLREASVEARWARQEAREDARYSDEKKYRDERSKLEDKRYTEQKTAQAAAASQSQSNWEKSYNLQERQMTSQEEARRVARIEETLNRIQTKFGREGEQIDRKYDRLIDKAEPEEKEALGLLRDKAHEEIRMKLNAEMLPALKSFGNDLKGTAYATYIDELANMDTEADDAKGRQFLQSAGVVDAAGNFINKPNEPKRQSRSLAVSDVLKQSTVQPQSPDATSVGLLKPGFLSGIQSGMSGFNNPTQIDESSITPLEHLTTAAGRSVVGTRTGLLMDGLEYMNNKAIQPAWAWANTPANQGRK